MLRFHPYSILTLETMVGFIIYVLCVNSGTYLNIYLDFSTSPVRSLQMRAESYSSRISFEKAAEFSYWPYLLVSIGQKISNHSHSRQTMGQKSSTNLESELTFLAQETGLDRQSLEEMYENFSSKKGINKKEFTCAYRKLNPK